MGVKRTTHDPNRCGQDKGYYAHRRRGENPCLACCDAHNERNKQRVAHEHPELAPCGTPAAYRRHLRHHEEPCQPCRAAHSTSVLSFQQRDRMAS